VYLPAQFGMPRVIPIMNDHYLSKERQRVGIIYADALRFLGDRDRILECHWHEF